MTSSSCAYAGREGVCAQADQCDEAHGYVCGAKAKDKALIDRECMEKSAMCEKSAGGFDYVCQGLVGEECPMGLNSTCAEDTLGYACADWFDKDSKTAGLRCLDPSHCGQPAFAFESAQYTATCTGLTGASCTGDKDCDPAQEMKCAAWIKSSLDFDLFYDEADETKCIAKAHCGNETTIGSDKYQIICGLPGAACQTNADCDYSTYKQNCSMLLKDYNFTGEAKCVNESTCSQNVDANEEVQVCWPGPWKDGGCDMTVAQKGCPNLKKNDDDEDDAIVLTCTAFETQGDKQNLTM